MQMPSAYYIIAILALLAAAACGLNLQFGRRPMRFAFAGFGLGLGIGLVALGAIVA
jgi:hypothetical protein